MKQSLELTFSIIKEPTGFIGALLDYKAL